MKVDKVKPHIYVFVGYLLKPRNLLIFTKTLFFQISAIENPPPPPHLLKTRFFAKYLEILFLPFWRSFAGTKRRKKKA
jgi:hypothetical protein